MLRSLTSPRPSCMPHSSHILGIDCESHILHHFQQQGLELLFHRYRCRFGEIDLIMQDDTHIIFIEIKARARLHPNIILEAITPAKQRRLILTALTFQQQHNPSWQQSMRIDVVGLRHTTGEMVWIQNAIEVPTDLNIDDL